MLGSWGLGVRGGEGGNFRDLPCHLAYVREMTLERLLQGLERFLEGLRKALFNSLLKGCLEAFKAFRRPDFLLCLYMFLASIALVDPHGQQGHWAPGLLACP